MEDPVAAVAESIVEYIKKEDLEGLNRNLSMSDSEWRQELRYEFSLERMLEAIFRNDIFIPKLIMCDIPTISPFHYAALRGVDSILERFILQYDIPVDMCVQSGSTALHFACFSGMLDTVMLLVERFHADINRRDRYGWSALHYASTEGNLTVIEYLVEKGADISCRDKDGTTAAFRAHSFGHVNVVSYFIQSSGDEDLLLVEDSAAADETEKEIIYSSINYSKDIPKGDDYEVAIAPSADGSRCYDNDASSAKTKDDVANLVRGELEDILAGNPDPYINPVSRSSIQGGAGKVPLDIGVNTLKRILKDEFLKFKADHDINKVNDDNKPEVDHRKDCSLAYTYEDISKFSKNTVTSRDISFPIPSITDEDENNPHPPSPPPPPPPPRNSSITGEDKQRRKSSSGLRRKSNNKKSKNKNLDRVSYMTLTLDDVAKQDPAKTKAFIILNRFDHSGTVMEACFQALVKNMVDVENWKILSTALPLRKRPDAVKRCIRNIEIRNPDDPRKQALTALQDWRRYYGEAANVESLIEAMKRSDLSDQIQLIENAAQEFAA